MLYQPQTASEQAIDLAPRTWSHWWLAWPKWFRIGSWAALGLIVLHFALVVRMYVGLQEPADIANLRIRCRRLEYSWEKECQWFAHHHTLLAGLHGKSWRNIEVVASHQLTADDLRTLRLKSPRLVGMSLQVVDFTPDLLEELAQCHQLTALSLDETDLDDQSVQSLVELKSLTDLHLRSTLISDEALHIIEHLPALQFLDVQYTDVSEEAIQRWETRRPSLFIARSSKIDDQIFLAVIRWSDGTRSQGVPEGYQYRTIWSEPGRPAYTYSSSNGLWRSHLHGNASAFRQGDGDYTMELRIGEYDATPVTVTVQDGVPIWCSVEFRMPCTKAEALRSAKVE